MSRLKSLSLAAVLAAFALVVSPHPIMAQKQDAADKPKAKEEKPKQANPDENAEIRTARRSSLLDLVKEKSLPLERRLTYFEALGNSYAKIREEEPGETGSDVVSAGVGLLDELKALEGGMTLPRAQLMGRVAYALGQVGYLGSDEAAKALVGLMDDEEEKNGECDGCNSPYAYTALPYFQNYLHAREYRTAAALALGMVGTESAVEALTKVLTRDEYPQATAAEQDMLWKLNDGVREAAVKGLATIGGDDNLGTLSIVAETDTSDKVREAAGAAIKNIQEGPKAEAVNQIEDKAKKKASK